MGCLCCCFRSSLEENPNALIKKDEASSSSPIKSYGAIVSDDAEPEKRSTSTPPSSGNELAYTGPITSARVKSPVNTIKESTSPRAQSPDGTSKENVSPVKTKNANGKSNKSNKPSMTLAELAQLVRTKGAFAHHGDARTLTPNPDSENDTNTKAEGDDRAEAELSAVMSPGGASVLRSEGSEMESDTCHSIGESLEDEDEEESEDAKIFRMLPSVPPALSVTPQDSNERLVSTPSPGLPSPGSSSTDVSKDSAGKKQSKAKDFMKKAGKKMKKTKKKMGKGVDKMLHRDKKKEEESKSKEEETTQKAESSLAVPNSAADSPFKRVSSDRMKSKYARERMAALEKKREEEASKQAGTSSSGITDPRLAALERGEKLSEAEEKTELMREHAAGFAQTAHLLRQRHGSSS